MNIFQQYDIISLYHVLTETSPSWNGKSGFYTEVKLDYADCKSDVKFRAQQIKMHAGIGTHIDSPAHAVEGGMTVDQLDIFALSRSAICIDVSQKATANYKVLVKDIYTFEKTYGKINKDNFVIVNTGWGKYWEHPDKYVNEHKFPSISEDAALLLLDRDIAGLGVDTLSPDVPISGFPVHKHILNANKYIIENIANTNILPPTEFFTIAMPIKGAGLTEAPVALLALTHKREQQ